jgi:hypothetical protein
MAVHPLVDATLLRRIWNEYIEMPGLRLTRPQAQRLWGVDEATCVSLLDNLVDLHFLACGADGKYARVTEGAEPVPGLRMAKAQGGARQPARGAR